MVCETKIVAAEDHEALPGGPEGRAARRRRRHVLPAASPPPGRPPPPRLPARAGPPGWVAAPGARDPPEGRGVYIREFRAAEQEAARRIFYDGIMERIPNTAFSAACGSTRARSCSTPCWPAARGPGGVAGSGPRGAPQPAAVRARPALWGRARGSPPPSRPPPPTSAQEGGGPPPSSDAHVLRRPWGEVAPRRWGRSGLRASSALGAGVGTGGRGAGAAGGEDWGLPLASPLPGHPVGRGAAGSARRRAPCARRV